MDKLLFFLYNHVSSFSLLFLSSVLITKYVKQDTYLQFIVLIVIKSYMKQIRCCFHSSRRLFIYATEPSLFSLYYSHLTIRMFGLGLVMMMFSQQNGTSVHLQRVFKYCLLGQFISIHFRPGLLQPYLTLKPYPNSKKSKLLGTR